MEKITIVVPSLNQEKFIPNLLTSLKRQTFQDFKVTFSLKLAFQFTVKLSKIVLPFISNPTRLLSSVIESEIIQQIGM